MSALPKQYTTAEEYLAIDRASDTNHEYINGEILSMTGGSFEHNRLALNIFRALDVPLDSQGCEMFINDVRVKITATGAYMYPDVIVVCGEQEAEDEWGDTLLNPIILIEVLSASTQSHDRRYKWAHYQRIPSLQEYLLVSQTEPFVEQYVRLPNNGWQYLTYTDMEGVIKLPSVGQELTMKALYRKILSE
jgi:Uma2 family endonuclease